MAAADPPNVPVREPSDAALAARANPPVGAAEANAPEWRAAEIPAANGHGTARAVAALYGVFAGRGSYDGRRVLSPAAAERLREGQGSCRDHVLPRPIRPCTRTKGSPSPPRGVSRSEAMAAHGSLTRCPW